LTGDKLMLYKFEQKKETETVEARPLDDWDTKYAYRRLGFIPSWN